MSVAGGCLLLVAPVWCYAGVAGLVCCLCF